MTTTTILRDLRSPVSGDATAHPLDSEARRSTADALLAVLSNTNGREHEWARESFFEYGYFAETVRNLRSLASPRERAAAARALGIVGSEVATADLIAAVFDPEPEVRLAAVEALKRIGDPSVNFASLDALFLTPLEEMNGPQTDFAPDSVPDFDDASEADDSFMANDLALNDLPRTIVSDLFSSDWRRRAAALNCVAHSGASESARIIGSYFDDSSRAVRSAAALALSELDPRRSAQLFRDALHEASVERRSTVTAAIIDSGLADDALRNIKHGDRELTYNALCLLSLLIKSHAVQPLLQAIEKEPSVEVRSAVVKLLTLNGQTDLAREAVKRRLNLRSSEAF
jgi:HEAT repeat protein